MVAKKGFLVIISSGLKCLFGFGCFVITCISCTILFQNYYSGDTIRKNKEVVAEGRFITSTVVICSDPPNTNISLDIVKRSVNVKGIDGGNLKPIEKLKTLFKGICDIVESEVFDSPKEDQPVTLCFNSSLKLQLYNLYPSQKLFVANFHPEKAIETTTIQGSQYHYITVKTKVKEFLADSGKCHAVGSHDPWKVLQAHQEYEHCIIKALVDINEQLFNITYHPIMDNYKMYENVTKAPFNISLNHHFTAAFQKCIRPCIEVFYSPTVDKYFITSDEDKRSLSSCDLADGFMLMSHIRKIDYELEDYIIKSVDLFSGIGGAVGLWLGWSFMSLGYVLSQCLENILKRFNLN